MSTLSRHDSCEYEQIFTLFCQPGSKVLHVEDVGDILLELGFCSSKAEAAEESRHFITKYDTTHSSTLCLEEFLLVAEDLELATKYLREGIRNSLAYFERRKRKQFQDLTTGPGAAQLRAEDLLVILRAGINALPRKVAEEATEDVMQYNDGEQGIGAGILEMLFPQHGPGKRVHAVEFAVSEDRDKAAQMLVEVISAGNLEHLAHGVFVDESCEKRTEEKRADAVQTRIRHCFNPVLVFESLTEYQETAILEDTMLPEWNQDVVLKLQPGTTAPVELLEWIERERYRVNLCDFRDDGTTSWREIVATGVVELSTVLYNATPGVSLPLVLDLIPTTINTQYQREKRNLSVELMLQPPSDYVVFYHKTVCLPREDLFLRIEKVRKDLCRGLKREPTSVRKAACVMKPRRDAVLETKNAQGEISTTVVSLSNTKFLEASKKRKDTTGFVGSAPPDGNRMEVSSWFEYPNILYPIWRNAVNRYSKALPSRPIGTLAKDEYGSFHFLPAFVNVVADCGETCAQKIADKVATLECINAGSLGLGYQLWSIVLNSPTLILRLGRGNLLELAVMLCSFFLGIGLNAYICVGARENKTVNAWVVVLGDGKIEAKAPDTSAVERIQHWDVREGKRLMNTEELLAHGFRNVYFMFNHHNLWANVQSRSSVDHTKWDLDEHVDWRLCFRNLCSGRTGQSTAVIALQCSLLVTRNTTMPWRRDCCHLT